MPGKRQENDGTTGFDLKRVAKILKSKNSIIRSFEKVTIHKNFTWYGWHYRNQNCKKNYFSALSFLLI